MKLSAGRNVWIAFGALIVLGVGAARLDVPRLLGPSRGDEASYITMAFSLAKDGDLVYTQIGRAHV